MKERRSLLNIVLDRFNSAKNYVKSKFRFLYGFNAVYTVVGDNIYDSNTVRQCIDAIATHSAKLMPKHTQNGVHIQGDINYLLSVQPNPIMVRYDFIYKIISNLYTDNNAFVFINYDKTGMIEGFYPVLANTYEFLQTPNGNIYLQFNFVNGRDYILPYEELIHLRRFYNKHEIFGEDNKILVPAVETANTANEGLANAIKISTSLRGIIKYTQNLKDKDIKESRDSFVNDFVNMENTSGIAAIDNRGDFKELNVKPITLDKDQLKQVNNNIYDYFRTSEKIVRSDYTPEEWAAFYEAVIEPLSMYLSEVFSTKIFNSYSIRVGGNKVVFTANRLQYASLSNKISLLKEAGALGILKKDEAREIIDLPALGGEEGEKLMQSLNMIDSKIANQYQGGED